MSVRVREGGRERERERVERRERQGGREREKEREREYIGQSAKLLVQDRLRQRVSCLLLHHLLALEPRGNR